MLSGKRRPERAGRPSWVKIAETWCPRLRSFHVDTIEAKPPPPRVKVGGGITFDRRLKFGIGATGHTQDIGYFGAIVPMTPATFARLTPQRLDQPDFVRDAVDKGKALGMPILYLDFDPETRTAQVEGHEGRGRMLVTRERAGDVPVPVAVMIRQARYGRKAPVGGDPKMAWRPDTIERRARTWTADTVAALNFCVLPEAYQSRDGDWRATARKLAPVACAFPEVYVNGKRHTVPECMR